MENKKNVLIFVNCFWINVRGMSGGNQMLIEIFKRIREEFEKIYIYTNLDGKNILEKNLRNIDYKISNKIFDRLGLFISYALRTLKAFSCLGIKNINIIYSSSDFFPDVIPAFLYKIFHKNTKWYQCVFHIYPNWKNRPGNKIKNFIAQYLQQLSFLLMKKADQIININTDVKKYLINWGFFPDKIIINTPGVGFDYLNSIKIKENEKKYDAVFLARLNPSKGIFDLIAIWEKIVKIKPECKLAIIGGGPEKIKNKLTREIHLKKLEKNIDILGYLENEDSFSLIKNSKIFLFPSHEEGFGIAIAEAMACKIPVISWDLPIFNEIFEDNLIQIKKYDVNLFCDKTIELLDNSELRKNISGKAFDFVKKYDWEAISKKHFEILNQ